MKIVDWLQLFTPLTAIVSVINALIGFGCGWVVWGRYKEKNEKLKGVLARERAYKNGLTVDVDKVSAGQGFPSDGNMLDQIEERNHHHHTPTLNETQPAKNDIAFQHALRDLFLELEAIDGLLGADEVEIDQIRESLDVTDDAVKRANGRVSILLRSLEKKKNYRGSNSGSQ